MPRKIQLIPDPKTNKLLYTFFGPDGVKQASAQIGRYREKDQQRLAHDAGVDTSVVISWFDQAFTQATPAAIEIQLIEPEAPTVDIWLRGITEEGTTPRPNEPSLKIPVADLPRWLRENLKSYAATDLIDWKDDENLACLDVDYHGSYNPGREWVDTTAATRLVPVPTAYHLSRGGGLHAFYVGVPGILTAKETASLALLRWRQIDPKAGVELKRMVRGPGGETVFTPSSGDPIMSAKSALSWLSIENGDPDGKSEQWCEEHGVEKGSRYAHTHCPIEPSGSGNRDPVVIGDDGVYCHVCAGKGVSYPGVQQPGFVPWSRLVEESDESRPSGNLNTLVRTPTHWGHAKWVIEAMTGLSGALAKQAYAAAIKLYHHDKPTAALIPYVFNRDTEGIARKVPNVWGTVEEGYTFPTTIAPILSQLPAAMYVSEKGEPKPNPSTVNLFQQPTIDLSDRGYPPIQVIRGVRLHQDYKDKTRLVVADVPQWLRPFGSALYPKYVEPEKRKDIAESKALIESVLPHVNWSYVEALILARASNEARVGLPQHIIVTGVSGGAKTSHVMLASGILGDVTSEVFYEADTTRLRSSIREASVAGSFLSINEFNKDALRQNPKLTPDQVMDPLLNFTPDSLSHKLHLGPVALGHIGVCIWTETYISEALRSQTQIARRVHHIHLSKKVDWESGLSVNGLSRPVEIRTIGIDYAQACNAIFSDIIDRHLSVPKPFGVHAKSIGVPLLLDSPEFNDPTNKLLAFFHAVCDAPDPTEGQAKRFPGKGFKVILRSDNSELSDLWIDMANGADDKQWTESKKISEKDWGELLNVPDEVKFDVATDGKRVAVRFRVGPKSEPLKVNKEIIT
jgi:hypothetical protein